MHGGCAAWVVGWLYATVAYVQLDARIVSAKLDYSVYMDYIFDKVFIKDDI